MTCDLAGFRYAVRSVRMPVATGDQRLTALLHLLGREIAGGGAFAWAARHVEADCTMTNITVQQIHSTRLPNALRIQPPTNGENAFDSDHTRLYNPW